MFHTILQSILNRMSPEDPVAYRLCRAYIDRANGDNIGLFDQNGEKRFADCVLPRCTTVFDVGANIGDWTAMAIRTNPKLIVHSFEPTPSIFAKLRSRKLPENVRILPLGLSDQPGHLEIHLSARGSGLTSLHGRPSLEYTPFAAENAIEQVELSTADQYIQDQGIEEIDLMKIDVEGHESAVLRGAQQALAQRKIGLIQFEYGGAYIDARAMLIDTFKLLRPHGYMLYKLYSNGLRAAPNYDPRCETFRYANWVAARENRIPWIQPLIQDQSVLLD